MEEKIFLDLDKNCTKRCSSNVSYVFENVQFEEKRSEPIRSDEFSEVRTDEISVTKADDRGIDNLTCVKVNENITESSISVTYDMKTCEESKVENDKSDKNVNEETSKANAKPGSFMACDLKEATDSENVGSAPTSISTVKNKLSDKGSDSFIQHCQSYLEQKYRQDVLPQTADIGKENGETSPEEPKLLDCENTAPCNFVLSDITKKISKDINDIHNNLQEKNAFGRKEKISCVENQKGNTVIFFRDINKKVTFDSDGIMKDENKSENMFASVDAKRNGRKRRYVKLIQKLEDTEKSLDNHLKRVMDYENKTFNQGDAMTSIEKVKEKLCIRAKKKYESLINYQRSQANVEQKSFEDLLPDKAEAVTANIVKQLGGEKQEPKIPRKRGRPCKKDTLENKKEVKKKKLVAKEKSEKQKKPKTEKTRAIRGFPSKFPCTLLQDSNTDFKLEKIRLGIMYKNGTKEVIELSDDTLKEIEIQKKPKVDDSSKDDTSKAGSRDSSLPLKDDEETGATYESSNDKTPLASEDGKSAIYLDTEKKDAADEKVKHTSSLAPTPPTTIQLPAVSSLESDYQLISISFLQDGKFGDFKRDHFFIPQATFNKGGQTGMVIVGPFCILYEPKPHIVLVSPKDHGKHLPMMILTKKSDFSPAGTEGHSNNDRSDHNYCSPFNMQESVKRFVKGIAKHTANAKFIDARVESIQEGDGNSLVTISGDNILKKVKNNRQHSTAIPISSTKVTVYPQGVLRPAPCPNTQLEKLWIR